NAIWEGSGNVMALDLLRVLQREPDTGAMVMDDLREAARGDAHLKAHFSRVEALLRDERVLERRAREVTGTRPPLAAASLPPAAPPRGGAHVSCAARVARRPRHTYGQGLDGADARAIVDRAFAR